MTQNADPASRRILLALLVTLSVGLVVFLVAVAFSS